MNIDSDLEVHLRRIARNPSPWIRGIRLHPDDIAELPRAEPKPVWMGGMSPLMGTPIFADETVARGGYEVATEEWIAAQARAREEADSKVSLTHDPQADTYRRNLHRETTN